MKARKTLKDISGKILYQTEQTTSIYEMISQLRSKSLKLPQVNFYGASLAGIQLYNFWLKGSDFTFADMTLANFSECRLNECKFEDGIFNVCNFTKTNLSNAVMRRSSFENADFRNSLLRDVDFSSSNLCGADLRGCRIIDCDFRYADLRNAIIDADMFSNVDMSFVKIDHDNMVEILRMQ